MLVLRDGLCAGGSPFTLSALLDEKKLAARTALPGKPAESRPKKDLEETFALAARTIPFAAFRAGGSGHQFLLCR